MEEIAFDFGLDELEAIKKMTNKCVYDFPAAYVAKEYIGFNRFASPIVPDNVAFYCTGELIIGLPTKHGACNAFFARKYGARDACKAISLPAVLREKKIQQGYYKVYKCKDGFAFKRYKPLDADGVEPA